MIAIIITLCCCLEYNSVPLCIVSVYRTYLLYLERTRFVLILRDRDNFIILSRIKIKTIIKFPQIKIPF